MRVFAASSYQRQATATRSACSPVQAFGSPHPIVLIPHADWYDVQSVVTHELGHALGLEDIGSTQRPWPGTFTDAPKHAQTMYRWYALGSTNKRTLAEGDILALTLAALESARDS